MRILSNQDYGNTARIVNLPNAVDPQEPVTKAQLDAVSAGTSWKQSVRVATQGNVNLAAPGASIDGITMASGDRVLVKAQTDAAENGIYVWGGAASAMARSADADTFDELEQAVVRVQEGTDANVQYRQTAVNGTLGTDDIIWDNSGDAVPPASESTAGIAELATQAEVNAGDASRIMSADTAQNATWMVKKYADDFGDASATQYDLTHNLGTEDVVVMLSVNATGMAASADITILDTNTVRVNVAAAPGVDALRAVVIG